MAKHNITGKLGESIAAEHLIGKGYELLDRNWRSGHNEIDIVARIGRTLVFVEVKTRSTTVFGEPELAVTPAKQLRTVQAANDYMEQKELDLEARFDVISVVMEGKKPRITHFTEAFYPTA